ncbi:MAG: apolipoprotein N-acyltransferase [Pseudomonadota bacterium]
MGISAVCERFAGHLILSWGWRRSGYAFLAGAFSALSMPPFDFFVIMFVTIPVLVWLLDATAADPGNSIFGKAWQAFKVGWSFGFGYFLAGLWWIGSAFLVEAEQFAWMLPFAVILLPAGLAIFYGLGTVLARFLWTQDWRRLLILGASIGLAEYLRGTILTGFPWNTIGYAALTTPILMQKASILGIYGVTVVSIPIFALPSLIIARAPGSRKGALLAFCAGLVLIGADAAYGWYRIKNSPQEMVADVRLRIVQPAIDQAEKWVTAVEERNFNLLLDLSRGDDQQELPGLSEVNLLIWPESTFPFILTERADALTALGELLPPDTILVAGAIRTEPPAPGQTRQRVFNSIYTINDQGEITGAADKIHLVPFGEYLPFQELAESMGIQQLTHLQGGFEAGRSRMQLDGKAAGGFLPLICYEIIFPGQIRDEDHDPGWLLNLTNDAWFGNTPGPYQHWRQAVVRGVEEGLPVVRAANNGISSVSDAYGRVLAIAPLGERMVIDSQLPGKSPVTIYSKTGNLLFWLLVAVFIATRPFRRT